MESQRESVKGLKEENAHYINSNVCSIIRTHGLQWINIILVCNPFEKHNLISLYFVCVKSSDLLNINDENIPWNVFHSLMHRGFKEPEAVPACLGPRGSSGEQPGPEGMSMGQRLLGARSSFSGPETLGRSLHLLLQGRFHNSIMKVWKEVPRM